jgi:hypothetical protein
VRRLKWIAGTAWVLSWYAMILEIFRWHHVTTSLRFNPPPSPPGVDATPHAGLFLIAVSVGSALAPPTYLTTVIVDRIRRRSVRRDGP